MNNSATKKLFAFIIAFVFDIIFILLFAGVLNIIRPDALINCVNFLAEGLLFVRILIAIVCLAFVALSVIFLITVFRDETNADKHIPLGSNSDCDNGNAFVSCSTVNSIAERYAKSNAFVKKCRSIVKEINPDGIIINMTMVVYDSANMTLLCRAVHDGVISQIGSVVGIVVKDVVITIESTIHLDNTTDTQDERRVK